MSPHRWLAVCLLTLAFLFPSAALSWGPTGHRVVALVAATLLTPAAQAQVAQLLGPTTTLADVATWADDIRKDRPATASWHYVDDPESVPHFAGVSECRDNCALVALDSSLKTLANPQADQAARAEALKWVVHLVADLHQPLHAGSASDKGGNAVKVNFFGDHTNLHWVWDSKIIDRAYPNPEVLRDQVAAGVASSGGLPCETETPEKWAQESHQVAITVAYVLPAHGEIDEAYVAKALPVMQQQLAKAAVRLSCVLNRALSSP